MRVEGPQGMWFEDFSAGFSGRSPSRTVTDHDIMAFAGLSGDYNPLHTDDSYAATTPFGRRIAHGVLGLSIATGLAARMNIIDGTTLAFLGLDWKFRKPVFAGDTVFLEIDVLEARMARALGGGLVTFGIRLMNTSGDVVQRGRWEILLKSRALAAEAGSASDARPAAEVGSSAVAAAPD